MSDSGQTLGDYSGTQDRVISALKKQLEIEKNERVDHPAHYGGKDNPYETIRVLTSWMTPEQLYGFCCGNAIKYLSRAGKKGSQIEDLKKAKWYLEFIINHMEKNNG